MSSTSPRSRWLFSTIGRRGYAAEFFKQADPSVFILGTGNTPHAPGFRECDEVRLMPDIADPAYKDAVLQLVEEQGIENILTFSDLDVVVLAEIRDALMARGATCWFPAEKLARLAQDKLETSRWAESNAMPTGQASMDLAAFEPGTPLIIKPRYGSSSVGLAFPPDHATAAKLAAGTTDAMFQRRIHGTEFNLEVLGDQMGHPVRCSVWRKYSSRGGETDLSRSVRRSELIELAWDLGDKLGLIGPNDIDLIVNDEGAHLIEINTRFGGGYPVSHFAGAGFPEALLAMSRGETVERAAIFRDGIWMMKSTKPFGGTDAEMAAMLGVSLEAHFPRVMHRTRATERHWKRAFDVVAASAALVVLSPVMAVVAVLVRCKLGSPVLFTQERPGLGGSPFRMLKFRSMRDACDEHGEPLPDEDRITPFGAALRRTSLDELPELVNVVKGDMSIVGPRPLLMQYLPLYNEHQARRHEVRPGVTGLAQVSGRNDMTWDEKFAFDIEYVDSCSPLLDLRIILRTVKEVLLRTGVDRDGVAVGTDYFLGNCPAPEAGQPRQ